MKLTKDKEYWLQGVRLVCPHLRGYGSDWVALEKDPCPTCESPCHNAGRSFEYPDRLIIVKGFK